VTSEARKDCTKPTCSRAALSGKDIVGYNILPAMAPGQQQMIAVSIAGNNYFSAWSLTSSCHGVVRTSQIQGLGSLAIQDGWEVWKAYCHRHKEGPQREHSNPSHLREPREAIRISSLSGLPTYHRVVYPIKAHSSKRCRDFQLSIR
jgi:hypothetical protein